MPSTVPDENDGAQRGGGGELHIIHRTFQRNKQSKTAVLKKACVGLFQAIFTPHPLSGDNFYLK